MKEGKKEQAHLAQAEDDKPTLLMAQLCALNDAVEELVLREEKGTAEQSISLDESHSQVHLGSEGDNRGQRWYLGFGASNHMTNDKDAFMELDYGVVGSVRFGNSSTVDIRGDGTIIFKC